MGFVRSPSYVQRQFTIKRHRFCSGYACEHEPWRRSWPTSAISVKLFRMLARIFVVFVFIFSSSGALIPLIRQQSGSTADPTQSDPVTQSIWATIYVLVVVVALLRWRYFVYVFTRDKLLVLLVVLALLSVCWSDARTITVE